MNDEATPLSDPRTPFRIPLVAWVIFGGGGVLLLMAAVWWGRQAFSPQRQVAAQLYQEGLEYARENQWEAAAHEWELAALINPSASEPVLRLMETYGRRGQPERAIPWMRALMDHRPRLPHLHCRLAGLYLAAEDAEAARSAAREAVEAEVSCPQAYAFLAGALDALGATKQALDAMELAQQFDPDDLSITLGLADLHVQSTNFDRAEQLLLAVMEQHPKLAEVHYSLGWIYTHRGGDPEQIEKAADYLRRTVELDPRHADAYAELGHLYLQQRRHSDAQEALEQSWALDDANARAAKDLAILYRRLGDERAAAMMTRYEEVARRPASLKALRRRFTTEPDNIEIALELAALYLQGDDHGMATQLVTFALRRQPDHSEALKLWGELQEAVSSSNPGAPSQRERGATPQ